MDKAISRKVLTKLSWSAFCCALVVFSMFGSSCYADNVTDQIRITVPASCSIENNAPSGDEHTATIWNLSYVPDIGTSTFKTYCNDNSGYAIYAVGYSNDEVGNTLMKHSEDDAFDFETGLATSGPDSNWAMKLTKVEGTYEPTMHEDSDGPYTSYHVVPNIQTKVVSFPSNTDMPSTGVNAIGSSFTATYAVWISGNQAAGTYTGKVRYTLVHPMLAPLPVSCNPSGTTIGTNSNTDIVCMQDFASLSSSAKSTIISNMVEGTQYTLTDKRDEKTYTISKLKDGKVWMTQNLDLDLDENTTYTNEDTDLGWNTSTNAYDTASWSPIRSTYETTSDHIHAWCQGGTWNSQYGSCENNNTPESYDPGNLYWNSETSGYSDWDAYYNSCDYSTTTPSCDESLNPLSTYVSSTGTEQYHLGNYYNWPAAIASNDASIYGAYNETTGQYENLETHQSICPAGWTLPYSTWNDNLGQSEGDFAGLWSEYGWTDNDGFSDISTVWSAPLYFAPAGYFNGNLGTVGYDGYFWSSVAGNGSYARYAYFSVGGGTSPAEYYNRNGGDSVRCLLR